MFFIWYTATVAFVSDDNHPDSDNVDAACKTSNNEVIIINL